jgi:probable HAF family extracellular repeat protein
MSSHPVLWTARAFERRPGIGRIGCVVGALLGLMGVWCEAAGPIGYQIRDIGVLPGGFGALGLDINNSGEITGIAYAADGTLRGVLYQQRRLEDLGLLPGFSHAFANAINDRTEIVGNQYTKEFGSFAGFLYRGGQLLDLIGIRDGQVSPSDINNRGDIVGNWQHPDVFLSEGFVFADGTFTFLPKLVPDGGAYPSSINDQGDVVGYATTQGGFSGARAVLWRNGQVQDLGVPLGSTTSAAYYINNAGTIVGTGANITPEVYRGFVYRNGAMTDVGTLSGFESTLLRQINNHDQIVGTVAGLSALLPTQHGSFGQS